MRLPPQRDGYTAPRGFYCRTMKLLSGVPLVDRKTILGFAFGPVAGAALSFITIPALAWLFSPEDIGRISMLQVVLSFSTILFCMGLDQAYVREYHEAEDRPATLLAASMPGAIILTLMLLAFLLFTPTKISELLFSIDSGAFSAIVAVCLLGSYFSRYFSLILRMQDRGLAFSWSQLMPKLLMLCLVVAFILLPSQRHFSYLLTAQAISICVAACVFAWNTREDWVVACRRRLSPVKVREMLSYGYPLVIGGVASWGLSAMDRIFLRSLATYEELAIYSVAASAAASVTLLSGIFNTIWSPMVYKWAANGVGLEKVESIARQLLACIAFVVPLAGMLSWIIGYALPHSYSKVPNILVGCMVSPLLYTLSEVTSVGIGLSRRTIYSMIASIIAVITNMALNYFFVPFWGAAGATTATMLAFFLFFVLRTEFSCIVWGPVPRRECYSVMFFLVAGSGLFAIVGQQWPITAGYLWTLLWITFLFRFKGDYLIALRLLLAWINERRLVS